MTVETVVSGGDTAMGDARPTAAVLGGSVSGLAAATGLRRIADIDQVTVSERQEYDEKRVDCGEAINHATLVPLATSNVRCEPGYVCERPVVERRLAAELEARGVEFRTGRSVSPGEYADIVESYDHVVDATGQPSLTLKVSGETREYTGDMVALNATVDGDFSAYENWPRIFFEGYVGIGWAFPKSDRHANVASAGRATGGPTTTSARSSG